MPQYPVADEGSSVYQKQFTSWASGIEFNGNQRCPQSMARGRMDPPIEEAAMAAVLSTEPKPCSAPGLTCPYSACGQEPIKQYHERLCEMRDLFGHLH